MKIFVTGATGYIGGSVAAALAARGEQVRGLARSEEGAAALAAMGVEPVRGTLGSWALLLEEAVGADAVINAASADHALAVTAFLQALGGTGKTLIHTSGSSVVADRAAGEHDGPAYTEDSHLEPCFEKAGRVAIDRAVTGAAITHGIRSIVLCPSMIYGGGLGPKQDSVQVPWLIELAREGGVPRHVGAGRNIWSNVHIADLVDLYLLALDRAPAGSFFFAENGELPLADIAAAIGRMLGQGERTEPMGLDEAARRRNPEAALFSFGSNSRVSAAKARAMLGWQPHRPGLLDEIERGYYARQHAAG